MAKRKTTTSSSTSKRATSSGSLLIGLVVLILLVISRLTGNDPFNPAPTATPTFVSPTAVANVPGDVLALSVPQGLGAQKSFWQVYFTSPVSPGQALAGLVGIDTALAAALSGVQMTLDIAAYEFNSPTLTQAVLAAKARGVRVRVVSDNEDGLDDDGTTLNQLVAAGIPVVTDERGALMHNKFMILDSTTVWTGSWNYTINDTLRNNNNALVLRSRLAVQNYQAEFDEMFAEGRFGPTSPVNTPSSQFTQDGVAIGVYFAPEDEVVPAIVAAIESAQTSIRFLAFSYTLDPMAQAMLAEARAGVSVQGVFETTGSETRFSELTPLFCAGLDVRQDGNPYILHHKVVVIDGELVLTGSFNFSANATDDNDENLVVIRDVDLAAQYLQEFERRWAEATRPDSLTCS